MLKDVNARELVALAPLTMMIFVIGLFPNIFLSRIKDAAARVESDVEARVDDEPRAAVLRGPDPAHVAAARAAASPARPERPGRPRRQRSLRIGHVHRHRTLPAPRRRHRRAAAHARRGVLRRRRRRRGPGRPRPRYHGRPLRRRRLRRRAVDGRRRAARRHVGRRAVPDPRSLHALLRHDALPRRRPGGAARRRLPRRAPPRARRVLLAHPVRDLRRDDARRLRRRAHALPRPGDDEHRRVRDDGVPPGQRRAPPRGR